MLLRLAGLAAGLLLLAPAVPLAAPPSPTALITPHGLDLATLDRTCEACDDFYAFAEGNYARLHPIPADRSRTSAVDSLMDQNRQVLGAILETAAHNPAPAPGSVDRQVGDFYAACMNTAAIESAGLQPLGEPLAIVDRIATDRQVASALAQLHLLGVNAYFDAGSDQDDKNASSEIFALAQGGLGLPDRDYYFNADPSTLAVRTAYVAHVRKLFELTGFDAAAAAAAAQSVMATETALASAASTKVALRDPEANYHVVPIATLAADEPHFDWNAYLRGLGVAPVTTAVVRQPAFFAAFDRWMAGSNMADIRTYLRWKVISQHGIVLPAAIDAEDFAFDSLLTGQKQQEPRPRRCVALTDRSLGEALGQLYVARAFTPAAKAQAQALVDNVQSVLRDDITGLTWMSPVTRARAVSKLDAYSKKIAYPDHWRVYAFAVSPTAAYANVLAALQAENARELAKIGKPVDRTEWGMTPPTVNAYYNAANNEIVFPAGILRPPFYDPNADLAYNYGAIGAVIGHEMTHGFDDQGSQYDEVGNLRSWWTPADKANFDTRAGCVAKYYDTLSVLPGVMQNGKLVEGEAIADLGGATIAYKAYERTPEARSEAVVDGFTPAQRFFLGFAQVWASNVREARSRFLANVDPHPAGKNRLNGTVANMPEFAAAWHCPMKAPLVRPVTARCSIW